MHHLTKLFRLVQTTRGQILAGYPLAEIPHSDISDLAQHHYLATFNAWQLAKLLESKGANIDVRKILEINLIHDLGELFGGDIALPYRKLNPEAHEAAKAFEKANQKFLTTLMQTDDYSSLFKEGMENSTDEAIIAKIGDYIEVTHYKLYLRRLTTSDIDMVLKPLTAMAEKMQDPIAKKETLEFLRVWGADVKNPPAEIFEEAKGL